MPRFFNTTGPCDAMRHYMLPPERRAPDLEEMIGRDLYFVLHAARQTGKTTAMRALADALCQRGYAAVWATLEVGQGITDIVSAEPLWISAIHQGAEGLPEAQRPQGRSVDAVPGERLQRWLEAWCRRCPLPVVLLLDEADTVSGAALVSFLRQLRAGFMRRGVGRFPTSIGLIGMRDLRDYLTESKDGVPVNPGSPFNIKKASVTLRNFTQEEVGELYAQHTADTGQVFTPEAVAAAFWWTQGQPYLVNELAGICADKLARDGRPITGADILTAKERLIQARTTHLDSLGERLKEERVMRVIQALLLGDQRIDYAHDDWQYCVDLGLVKRGLDGAEAANPLYREVLVRELTWNEQMNLKRPWWKWATPEGKLDMPALVDAFLAWWRVQEQAIYAHGNKLYPEALPHLTFMAFLQRVVNGGGTIHQEFAAGREAVDLVVEYAGERHVIELKRVHDRALEPVREAAVVQLSDYLDTLGERTGWLLLFDQRKSQTWEQRLWREDRQVEGRTLYLRGA